MGNVLYISKKKLPPSPDEAIEFIYDYFNEFELVCRELDDCFQVELGANQYTYCEDISKGLEFLNISDENVKDYCIVDENSALCLSENWLPFAFAKFIAGADKKKTDLTILHIDDHRDLMQPYLSCQNGRYIDMISGETIDLLKDSSVKKAVKSGAITIGSMLTAIVYSMQQVDIFHIKEAADYMSCGLKKTCVPDNLLQDTYNRISVLTDEAECSTGRYYLTSEWSDVISRLDKEKPCLLHIDMDYFNNRYNASTSWMENQHRHDPSFAEQMVMMNKLFAGIKEVMKLVEIKYVMIGISPSFYPVEYWSDGLQYLVRGLSNLGVPVGNILSSCRSENHT